MTNKKVIAVVGATGATAGGLPLAILENPNGEFACRALTRDPSSEAARGLRDRGAEVVRADLYDERSLVDAFDGAYGVFCMTNGGDYFSADEEIEQAANLARASKAVGIRHAVWVTHEDSRDWFPLDDDRMPTLQGRYKVPLFDGKAEGSRLFRDAGVPTTFLLSSTHWEVLFTVAAPQRGDDGVLVWVTCLGGKKLPGIAPEDIGRCAYGIFNRGDEFIGKSVGVAGDHLTGTEMTAALSGALGEEVRYVDIPPDVFRAFPVPGADIGGNLYQFIAEANDELCAHRDLELARSLNPRLQTFAEWVAVNKHRIPVSAEVQ